MAEQPPEGRLAAAAGIVRSLSLGNVLTIALLALIALPAYTIWKALSDPALLDRMLSSFKEESSQQTGCTLREAKIRGGQATWGISTGWAFHGGDRYFISVAFNHEPTTEELVSYCATLKLVADKLGMPP